MKLKFLLILSFLFLIAKPVQAVEINTQTELEKKTMEMINNSITGEQIKNFESKIAIQKDGSLKIVETIEYYFDYPKHGIYRNIPFTIYDKGKRYDMQYSFNPVLDENGKKYKVAKSQSGEQWVLKIGDPNKTITGDHTYVISYSIKGGLQYFSDHDELYWNITGNGWDVPIKKATAIVTLPVQLEEGKLQAKCYTGVYSSTKSNCTIVGNNQTTLYATTLFLNSSEGLTIVEGFPKNTVATLKPTLFVPYFERWYGKLTLLGIGVVAFLWYIVLPIYLIIKWFQQGRDPEVGIAVRATFDPPKLGKRFLTPGETGSLVDETVDNRDIFAIIVDLARRGYLRIEEPSKKDFYLRRITSSKKGDKLLDFEEKLLNGIFLTDDYINIKKTKMYVTIGEVKKMLYTRMVDNGYFTKNPNTTRTRYYALGSFGLFTFNFVLAMIAFVFGRVMPRKTLLGAQTAKQAEGLKNFLTSQERQLNFQGDKQMLFEKLLPFASAFGVEKAWAKRFETFDLKNPDWYTSYSGSHFNSALFVSSLSNSSNSFAASATPPSSSGSGFSGGSSGGGGGGGGGGSW